MANPLAEDTATRFTQVSVHAKAASAADSLQRSFERSGGFRGIEQRTSMVTTDCDEVGLARLMEALESKRHGSTVA